MSFILGLVSAAVLMFLALVSAYQWGFALISLLWPRFRSHGSEGAAVKFLIMIPAHNEEVGLPDTLTSIAAVQYPRELLDVLVVADRCTDATNRVAREAGVICFERIRGEGVKGAAVAWGIQEASRNGLKFDALIILDADTRINPELLNAFSKGICQGHKVQQAFNYLSNPWETAFTRVIAVTSMLKNGLFYTGKSLIGLSGMLQGTGMCLERAIVEQYGWNAFSVGEDWEFSVSLFLAGERIYFNPDAMIYARESSGVRQASRQRLRWATGRYAVTGTGVWRLIRKGVEKRSVLLLDAAVTLLCPNYSTQASLALMSCAVTWYLRSYEVWMALFPISVALAVSLAAFFALGILKTESPLRALAGIPFMLIFLPWRLGIEILGLLGFGRKDWGRSARDTSRP
jgi:cellulose synthase/poly-beta-1,6-N-acetylglucosamine synthase-like glycosyltransferase